MDDQTLCGLMEVAHQEANRLIAQGMSKPQAIDISVRALGDLVQSHETGLGQGPTLSISSPARSAPSSFEAPEAVKEVEKIISPWLWIFSVVGFGLALLNTQRISRIYGGWRAGKKAVKEGRLPR